MIRGFRKIGKVIASILRCFINAIKFVVRLFIPQKTKKDHNIADTQTHPKLPKVEIKEEPQLANIKKSEAKVASVYGVNPVVKKDNTELEIKISTNTALQSNLIERKKIFSKLDIFLNEETDKIPPLKITAEDFQYTIEKKYLIKNEKVLIGSGMSYDAYLATHKAKHRQNEQLVVLANRSLICYMKHEPPNKSRDEELADRNKTKVEARFKKEHQAEKNTCLITKENEPSLIVMPYKGCELNSFRSIESEEAKGSEILKQKTIKKSNAEIKNNISNLLAIESPQKSLADKDQQFPIKQIFYF